MLHTLNIFIFNFINGGAGQYTALDTFLLFLTSYLAYGISLMVTIYLLVWIPSHATDLHERLHALRHGIEFVFAILSTYVLVQIVKVITMIPRPFTTLVGINSLSPYEGGYSFPSGHAAMTVAIATIVYLHHKRLGALLYGFAIIVCISRVYVGVHYPKDVIIGSMLGFAFAGLMHILFCRITTPQSSVASNPKKG